MKDTIVAIATAKGTGAISVIRLSGDEAISITSSLCDKDFSIARGNSIHHAWIYEDKDVVDEVLISIFKNPHSYTGEDSVEISCHGGIYITRKILSLFLGKGARMARPGEFTERAFLNGKMDLAQAEAVNDLILASNALNARASVHSLKGSITKLLAPLEEELTQIIAHIEVNIDYPEYDDVEVLTDEKILPMVRKWIKDIEKIIHEANTSVNIREGIKTVIVGKPNVGKSSLLNALLEEDKAIVTDIAGTTRDLVEGIVSVGGIPLRLIDTAGIHESKDKVEQIGIERSLKAMDEAELIIVVLDDSKELNEEDLEILEKTKDRNRIVVYNKKDLGEQSEGIHISASKLEIDELKEAIVKKYEEDLEIAQSDTLHNERQIGLALQAKEAMVEAKDALEAGYALDLVTIDLQKCWNALKEITGKVGREDLLDEIFSRFCLGK